MARKSWGRVAFVIGLVVGSILQSTSARADCASECSYYSSCSEACINGDNQWDTCQSFPPCGDGSPPNTCSPQAIDHTTVRRVVEGYSYSSYYEMFVCYGTEYSRNWNYYPCTNYTERLCSTRSFMEPAAYPEVCGWVGYDTGMSCEG